MDRREWLRRCTFGASGVSLPLLAAGWLRGVPPGAASMAAAEQGKLPALKIIDIKTMLTAPADIRLVVVKVHASSRRPSKMCFPAARN